MSTSQLTPLSGIGCITVVRLARVGLLLQAMRALLMGRSWSFLHLGVITYMTPAQVGEGLAQKQMVATESCVSGAVVRGG